MQTLNIQTKLRTEAQRFAKLHSIKANAQSQPFCTTFNFTQTHPSPLSTLKVTEGIFKECFSKQAI